MCIANNLIRDEHFQKLLKETKKYELVDEYSCRRFCDILEKYADEYESDDRFTELYNLFLNVCVQKRWLEKAETNVSEAQLELDKFINLYK